MYERIEELVAKEKRKDHLGIMGEVARKKREGKEMIEEKIGRIS